MRRVFTKEVLNRIDKMRGDGFSNKEIAAAIGTTEGSLMSRTSQLGLSREKRFRVHFPDWVFKRCVPHAARRDISPAELIKLLIDRIVQDNLFNAILDDGE